MKPYEDLDLMEVKHPLISELERDLLQKQPINMLLHIKKWAKQKLREEKISSEEDDEVYRGESVNGGGDNPNITTSSNSPTKTKALRGHKMTQNEAMAKARTYRRRNAIFMTQTSIQFDQGLMSLKVTLTKNEECKSRIMLTLRSLPFLGCLSWEQIYKLVQIAKVREYFEGQQLVKIGDALNYLYIIIQGQVVKGPSIDSHQTRQPQPKKYTQGDAICQQSIISIVNSKSCYQILSEHALLASIQSFTIHQLSLACNIRREQQMESCMMNISLFSALDPQELYKLTLMVKQIQYNVEDVAVHAGNRMSALFFVMEGEFSRCKVNLSGEIVAYRNMVKGECFGDEWVIQRQIEAQYAVICKISGKLGIIERESIERNISKIDKILERKKKKGKTS